MKSQILGLATMMLVFTGCFDGVDYAYLGDRDNNKIVKVDMNAMEMVTGDIESGGDDPYEVGSNGSKIYSVNRQDYQINILNFKGSTGTETIDDTIQLPIMPRSIIFKGDEAIVSSTSDAALMLIDTTTNELVTTCTDGHGDDVNYGGSYKSGHPLWVDEEHFMLSDRSESSIELYNKASSAPIDKLTFPTSVHHIEAANGFYYAPMEGKKDSDVSPGVVKFHIDNGAFVLDAQVHFSEYAQSAPIEMNVDNWGGHHLAVEPESGNVFMGSREGNVFILSGDDLSLVDVFKAGIGAGHILFTDSLAVVTNHFDSFKTVYNLKNSKVKNIETNTYLDNGKLLQSHSSWVREGYLYFIASSDKKFVEVNLKRGKVTRTVDLGDSYCLMGTKLTEVPEESDK